MTLIAVCVTDDFIIQVSDRRNVWLTGPDAGKRANENANKVVVYCNHMAFAHSGLAQIDGPEPTPHWLLESLRDLTHPSVMEVLNEVKRKANRAFRNINLPKRKKRHAFVLAGWTDRKGGQGLIPFVATVSNALTSDWKWEEEADEKFKVDPRPIGNASNPQVFWFGQPFGEEPKKQALREIKAKAKQGEGPGSLTQTLHLVFRRIADEHSTVGKNLMVMSFPRRAMRKGGGISIPVTNKFPDDEIVAKFLWEGANPGEYPGPDLIGCHPGGHPLMKDIRVSTTIPGGLKG